MLKYFITLTAILLMSVSIQAQNIAEAIIFTENGEKFTASINGIKINDKPANRVEIPNLEAEFYKLKLDFEDPGLTDFNGNMMVEIGTRLTYMAKQNRRGKFVIRPVSEAPLAEAKPSKPAKPAPPANPTKPPSPVEDRESHSEEVTTTTTTRGTQDGVKMDVEIEGTRMSVDMQVPDMEVEESSTVTTTTTTKTQRDRDLIIEEEVVEESAGNCGMPMNSADFESAKSSIESKSFEDSQLTVARQITRSNCLKADQVKSIVEIFDFEDTKLEYAKFAYDYTVDQNNFYKVNDAFDFESTIEELNEYLESK